MTLKVFNMRIQVKDFMSSPVTTAVAQSTVKEIRNLMKKQDIHAVPIVEYAKQLPNMEVTIKGIVSSSDLNQKIGSKHTIEDIMTTKVHIAHPDSSAQAAANMMMKHHVHHIVVMEDGKIIGMLSSMDFVKLVAEHTLD